MELFWIGFEKQANVGTHLAEIAGLGTLAAPSIQKIRGKPLSEKSSRKAELGGLGILAAPSVYALGKTLLTKGK